MLNYSIAYLSASREASPIRASEKSIRYRSEKENHRSYSANSSDHILNGHVTTEPSDDEYIDTVEVNMIYYLVCSRHDHVPYNLMKFFLKILNEFAG